jgi:hypothetical protein
VAKPNAKPTIRRINAICTGHSPMTSSKNRLAEFGVRRHRPTGDGTNASEGFESGHDSATTARKFHRTSPNGLPPSSLYRFRRDRFKPFLGPDQPLSRFLDSHTRCRVCDLSCYGFMRNPGDGDEDSGSRFVSRNCRGVGASVQEREPLPRAGVVHKTSCFRCAKISGRGGWP